MFLNFLCKELGMLRLNWIIDVEKDTLSYSYRRTRIIFLLISFTIKQLYSLVISNLMPCNAIIASYYFSSNIATISPSITSSGSASTSNTSTHGISPYWFIQYPLRARFSFTRFDTKSNPVCQKIRNSGNAKKSSISGFLVKIKEVVRRQNACDTFDVDVVLLGSFRIVYPQILLARKQKIAIVCSTVC